jgi:hypothetical protein
MSESTDEKLMGNFRKLIDFCAAHPNYSPPNPLHLVVALEAQYAGGVAAMEDIDVKLAPHKVDINERKIAYDAIPKLYRRSRNNLKSCGASKEFVADAETYFRKITGRRKTEKVEDDPATPENEAAKKHSASQMSYESILGNVRGYNALVKNEPLYKSNEADLKTANLDAVADDLEAKNNAVSASFPPVGQARSLRDGLLYNNPNHIVDTALSVKEYTKSMADDTLYKSIKSLKFPRQRK